MTHHLERKMGSTVYSAARAVFPLHGRSIEQAWDELTAMFERENWKAKSYIVNGHRLECVRRSDPQVISVGDVFKYNCDSFVNVVQVSFRESFTYDEQYLPTTGQKIEDADQSDSSARMEFHLRSHPEATLVEIRRRMKGVRTLRERIRGEYVSSAAYLLQRILLGGVKWQDEIVQGDVVIRRDDSYRIHF